MANERIYSIKLNGITESVDLVDKLLKKLEDLEKRINTLQGKTVSVGASGGGGSSKSGGADLYDKIEKTQQRINQASDEEYKILLKKKAELKEIEKEQKAIVAGERAEQQEYANTLNGQRQKLADMKAALGNITIGSADFEKQVQEIDALNSKILEIEKSYGQYGRNVGNYANGVAEGLTKVTIKVGETERTFNSAKEASRTLGNELKSMAVNGEQNTQAYSDLDEAFKKLQSTMKDVSASSKMMDNLLDTMQGLTAIGSIGQGFAALFGIDDSEIQKSIQKLVALQNVLQGLETLNKQLKTGEGFMGWFSKGNELIEKFSQNLMGVKTTATATATELEGVATAEKSVATSSTIAARGAKLLAGALKSIIIIGAGVALGKWLQSLTSQFSDVEKAANDVRDKMSVAYNSAKRELESYNKILQNFVGTKKDEEAIVNQLNSKYGSAMGTYKTIAQWKDVLVKKTEAYCEAMRLEAEMAAATKDLEDAYLNLQRAKRGELTTWQTIKSFIYGSEGYKKENIENAEKNVDAAIKWADNTREKLQNLYQKAGLFDFSPQIKSASAKVGETIQQQEQELTRLRIRAMDDGLQKVVAEINYNAIKEIDALKLTGARKAEAIELIEKERQRKIREAEAKDYRERIEARRNFNRQINQLEEENARQFIENAEQDNQNFLDQRENNIKLIKENYDKDVPLTPSYFEEYPKFLEQLTKNLQFAEKERYEEILEARKEYYKDILFSETVWDKELYKARVIHIKKLAQLEKDELEDELQKTFGSLDTVGNILLVSEDDISKAKEIAKNYGGELGAAFASGKISIQEYKDTFDKFYADYLRKYNLLKEKTDFSLINLDTEIVKKYSKAVKQETDSMMKDIEDIITGTERRYNSTKVTDVFGIVDLSASKKLTKETVAVYRDMQQRVQDMMDELTDKFKKGKISTEEYRDAIEKLTLIYQKLGDKTKETEEKQADFTDFLSSIMPYVSQLANGLQNILGQVSNLVSAEFEAQRQKLDDEIALLEEKYNEMEELEQRHADKINAIEDEIANARGARRDYLVSLYNAEIEAQRKAYQEKLIMDAELKRKEEEQKALEKAERKKQDEIQFQQALMSQSLAILNAFATKPWEVGVVMGAMATALTGIQIALMKKAMAASEKYADGGVIQGRSHSQGGVKVLGGRAEVEGGEYITNKRTTALNEPVLDYINSKHRTLTAADFLEFYNGKGNKAVKNNFKTKFASGGALPAVSATKNSNIVIVKDESHPVVSVVDIINATDNYNNVRVLAGVDE